MTVQDIILTRQYNVLGEIDSLRFFVPEVGTSINIETDCAIELPDGFAFKMADTECSRIGDEP